ncbi:MAG: GNAT family N-acetyltransferase [Chitinophagales bacterium]|nr:GNAT family N-acetyltransferase [Chitinophagales bacterium]
MQTNYSFIQIEYGTELYQEMVHLRFLVLRKPLGLTYTETDLLKDKGFNLFALKHKDCGALIACCCLEDLHPIYRLRQMAVHPDFQQKNWGSVLLSEIETWAKSRSGIEITMHARSYAIPFYQKSNYSVVGEEFLEVGIPHCVMTKLL